ncbi:MAG TPA: hypothetical protein VN643_16250 [Pyrinomonadaceae bacterium]|nr:hypothetical protein [Pyrinomonadaceae bacterium]
METLDGLEFYLKTLEKFISDKEDEEVSNLRQHADQWPTDKQGEFWAWHYPGHWEEIFASQLRSSFVVTLISLAESQVGMVTEQVSEIAAIPKSPDSNGGQFERHRKQLKQAGLSPNDACWNSLYDIRSIRNCLVHANSRIRDSRKADSRKEKHLRLLINRLPGLSAPYDVVELSSEFPKYCLERVKEFVVDLYKETSVLCQGIAGSV